MNNIEREITKKETEIIKQKADYIADHSLVILEKLDNESFLRNFINFLISYDETEFSEIPNKINPKHYMSSISVIFKVCENLGNLDFDNQQIKNLKEIIRQYPRYFKQEELKIREVIPFINVNIEELEEVEEKIKTK